MIKVGGSKWWYGLQAVGKSAIYGAETYIMGVNAPYPDGLKAIPPCLSPDLLKHALISKRLIKLRFV